jgi:hypothetical protein
MIASLSHLRSSCRGHRLDGMARGAEQVPVNRTTGGEICALGVRVPSRSEARRTSGTASSNPVSSSAESEPICSASNRALDEMAPSQALWRTRYGISDTLKVARLCRNRSRDETVEWIDALIGKYSRLHVNKVVAVSSPAFSAEAERKAHAHKIQDRRTAEHCDTPSPLR